MCLTDVGEGVNLKSGSLYRLVLKRYPKNSMSNWGALHVGEIAHNKNCETKGLVPGNELEHQKRILLREMDSIYLFQQQPEQLLLTSLLTLDDETVLMQMLFYCVLNPYPFEYPNNQEKLQLKNMS